MPFAEGGEGLENFAFQAFEVFKRNVEKVAGAAGGIEDACVTETAMEVEEKIDGVGDVAGIDELRDGGDDV